VSKLVFREDLIKKLYIFDLLGAKNYSKQTAPDFLIEVDDEEKDFPLILSDADQENFFQITQNISQIDEIIKDCLIEYHLARLSYLDRAIIRLATYSLVFEPQKASSFIFTEMLELTKTYTDLGDSKQKNFNHRLLTNIKAKIGRVDNG
jgi:N utilization substance protein B